MHEHQINQAWQGMLQFPLGCKRYDLIDIDFIFNLQSKQKYKDQVILLARELGALQRHNLQVCPELYEC